MEGSSPLKGKYATELTSTAFLLDRNNKSEIYLSQFLMLVCI